MNLAVETPLLPVDKRLGVDGGAMTRIVHHAALPHSPLALTPASPSGPTRTSALESYASRSRIVLESQL